MKLILKYYFAPLFIMIFITGCARLQWLDDKAGDALNYMPLATTTPAAPEGILETASGTEPVASTTPAGVLTEAIKSRIDAWLEANKLNRYGDATGTMYAGGTPLFNEMTGESVDRFDFLLKKIPGLLDKIKD